MTVIKYLHSCILFVENDEVFLIDPGIFTYTQKALDITGLKRLDYILLTHAHPDHMYIPFIKDLVNKFPIVRIYANVSIATELKSQGIQVVTKPTNHIDFYHAPHESLWDGTVPDNSIFHIGNKLTHPGDSLKIDKTGSILCLPITAPWGSTTEAVTVAVHLKPKFVVPIHDWLWKDEVRKMMYARLSDFFATKDSTFLGLETGEVRTM